MTHAPTLRSRLLGSAPRSPTVPRVGSLPWFVAAILLAACPGGDDDSAADDDTSAADDDTSGGDDDTVMDDDTSTGDDDTGGDDDTSGQDWVNAAVPDFADCTGNQFKVILGDGTALGPFAGEFGTPTSFANTNGQWALRLGPSNQMFSGLQGNNNTYVAGQDIAFVPSTTSPPAGAVSLSVFVNPNELGGAPAATGGAFGYPTVGADSRVGGSVNFSGLPLAGATGSGRFSAILQSPQQSMLGHVVLLGVAGCFSQALSPTDGGG